ncbi:MAG: DMT family transporter [Polyangiaceae bacterium]|nr:DMT family transporter [Polyangiaceae bacterium]
MSSPLAYGVLSTMGWSAFDVMRKRLVSRLSLVAVGFWVNAVPALGYAIWFALSPEEISWDHYLVPWMASVALNMGANLLYLYAVKVAPLSVVIPLLSFTPIFAAIGAIPLLGEHLLWEQWIGAGLVSWGAFLLGRKPSHDGSTVPGTRNGMLAMLLVAALWSVTPLLDKLALRASSPAAHGSLLSALQALFFALIVGWKGSLNDLIPRKKKTMLTIAGASAASFWALGLQFIAITQMAVSVFEALKRALCLLFALALGALLFQEEVTGRKVFALLMMAGGVTLVLIHHNKGRALDFFIAPIVTSPERITCKKRAFDKTITVFYAPMTQPCLLELLLIALRLKQSISSKAFCAW